MDTRKIKAITVYPTGIVTVLDENDQPMVELQGKLDQKRYDKIMANSDANLIIHGRKHLKRILQELTLGTPENLQKLITEARRELKMREKLYPQWISQDKIKVDTAAHRIDCMREIVLLLEKMNDANPLNKQTKLF